MNKKFAVIGVGNMAKSIIDGITSTDIPVSAFYLFDKFPSACDLYKNRENFYIENNIISVVEKADCILLSVKPQNYPFWSIPSSRPSSAACRCLMCPRC